MSACARLHEHEQGHGHGHGEHANECASKCAHECAHMCSHNATWRLLIDGPQEAAWNMAVDEAILIEHGRGQVPPTLRFYFWQVPTLSLGYFQDMAKEIDLEACAANGVAVVRRPTGGRAVLHNKEVTYSIVASRSYGASATVLESYQWISGGLARGLELLGLEVQRHRPMAAAGEAGAAPVTTAVPAGTAPAVPAAGSNAPTAQLPRDPGNIAERLRGSAACFDSPSWYEITVGGKKIIGSAQVRRDDALLQHGSILLETQSQELFALLRFEREEVRERSRRAFESRATGIREALTLAATAGRDQARGQEILAAPQTGASQISVPQTGASRVSMPASQTGTPQVEPSAVIDAMITGFSQELGIVLQRGHLTENERILAEELLREKYGNPAWNRERGKKPAES